MRNFDVEIFFRILSVGFREPVLRGWMDGECHEMRCDSILYLKYEMRKGGSGGHTARVPQGQAGPIRKRESPIWRKMRKAHMYSEAHVPIPNG